MKKISEKVLFQGQWLSVVESSHLNDDGDVIKWESIRRAKPVRSVVVLAQLIPSKKFILVKQYRPAIDGYILGLPAGLGEGSDEALKELKEETGFYGTVVSQSPLLKTSSGVINDSGILVYAHVDQTDERNQNPQQELEPSEEIQVHLVERNHMKDFFLQEHNQGTHIGANLWYLFVATQMMQ